MYPWEIIELCDDRCTSNCIGAPHRSNCTPSCTRNQQAGTQDLNKWSWSSNLKLFDTGIVADNSGLLPKRTCKGIREKSVHKFRECCDYDFQIYCKNLDFQDKSLEEIIFFDFWKFTAEEQWADERCGCPSAVSTSSGADSYEAEVHHRLTSISNHGWEWRKWPVLRDSGDTPISSLHNLLRNLLQPGDTAMFSHLLQTLYPRSVTHQIKVSYMFSRFH